MSESNNPRWMRPMQLKDELNQRRLQNVSGGELSVGQLVVIDTLNVSKSYLAADLALADGTWKQEFLFVVGQHCLESGTERRDKFRARTIMVLETDTSGASVHDPVYLSDTTPGAFTLSVPANIRKVGQVLEVGTNGKVVLAPQMFQGAGNVPFVLDQKWRDDFDADWEGQVAPPVNTYVDNVTGDDDTGDGSFGNPYASIRRAILEIPHNRSEMLLADATIKLIHTGTAYEWPGQACMEGLDRVNLVGTPSSFTPTPFTTVPGNIGVANDSITIEATLAGTLTDQYKGFWVHKDVSPNPLNWLSKDSIAHVHSSTYLGGGVHRLSLSDRQATTEWIGDLNIADPNDILVKLNMRLGVFTPGEQSTVLHNSTQMLMLGLWFQNATRMELLNNEELHVQNSYIETLEWVFKGGSTRFDRVYIKNSTPAPIRGCLDVTGGELILGDGNTMAGDNVVEPDAGLTSGTLASLWLHDGAHVRVEGGMWLRSHAHIEVDRGTFHRTGTAYLAVVQGVFQGGPGYTVPAYVTARKVLSNQQAGPYDAGELSVKGGLTLASYEYVVAAVGHDISWSDDSNLLSTHTAVADTWVSADGGVSKCSYDPGKGTRVRINDDDTVGIHVVTVPASDPVPSQLIDWARGEALELDPSNAPNTVGEIPLEFRHPRLGEEHKLWVYKTGAGATINLVWPANVVWPAGAPPVMTAGTYQLYRFRYYPRVDKWYGEHTLVDVT